MIAFLCWYAHGWIFDTRFRLAFRWWTWRDRWLPRAWWCKHKGHLYDGYLCMECGTETDRESNGFCPARCAHCDAWCDLALLYHAICENGPPHRFMCEGIAHDSRNGCPMEIR